MTQVGERAPDFVLPVPGSRTSRFYGHAGGLPTVLLIPGRADPAAFALLGEALRDRSGIAVFWIVVDPAVLGAADRGWIDADGAVATGFGVDAATGAVVVLDPNLRIVDLAPGIGSVDELHEHLANAAHPGQGSVVAAQAPVLMVPRVVAPDLCAALIAQCRADAVETGVESSGADAIDRAVKRRRDVTVSDPEQLRHLSAAVGRRLMPEIERAFGYRATRFEGFKIAQYDADTAGFFAPHRDNLTPATAHRVFGLSINLNEDYQGGELGFPEYGNECYRAPAGAAMVFSSALLHAVRPVAQGSRFVLLSFLFSTR